MGRRQQGCPRASPELSIGLCPVRLGSRAVEEFYHGFSNRTLWPLLHNSIERPVLDRAWWRRYDEVNRKFAAAAVDALDQFDDAVLWVHDPPERLFAYYALADVMLVTPLIDGMNLVAKEFVVVQDAHGDRGVLVLSEFTGAAEELREAVSCNPFDVDGLSRRIEHALELQPTARRRVIRAMAQRVDRHDVHAWLDRQLSAIDNA